MTDGPDAGGWWQASDGKWYPPETNPANQVAAPAPTAATPVAPMAPVAPPPVVEPAPVVPAAAPELGPLASTLAAAGAVPTQPAAEPPAAAPVEATAPAPKPEHERIRFDKDGWITLAPDTSALPQQVEAESPWKERATLIGGIAVALVVVIAAGVLFIPRGGHRPTETAAGATPTTRDVSGSADPLTLDSVLTEMNVRLSDVGDGYEKAIDGAVDPIGGDPCTQPHRPFAPVASTHWTAYNYRPNGLGGLPLGHLASVITVFDHTADANKRLGQERQPDYTECLKRWDRQVWFEGSDYQPVTEQIAPIPVTVEGAKPIGFRYAATFVGDDGRTYPIFTDHIIFTKGRVRVWVEVSSALITFDQGRRDLLVSRISKRVDDAIAND